MWKDFIQDQCMEDDVDLQYIASSTNGFGRTDLRILYREAEKLAYRRTLETAENDNAIKLKMLDWKSALSVVHPSITVDAEVTWDDIGGVKDLKEKLEQAVEQLRINHRDASDRIGIPPVHGVLLHGIPGCGKTILGKAVARAAQATFLYSRCSDLYLKYSGDGNTFLHRLFQKAREAAPSIIFLDEIDYFNGSENLLSTLLTEMDGLEQAREVIVLGATNWPQGVNAELIRRFDKVLYVPPPDMEGRLEILRIIITSQMRLTSKMRLGEDVDLMEVASRTDLFTGADLRSLWDGALISAISENTTAECGVCVVYSRHFEAAQTESSRALSFCKSRIEEYEKSIPPYFH